MNAVQGISGYLLLIVVSVLLVGFSTTMYAQTSVQPPGVSSFLSELVGEWVGTCEQRMENDKLDRQYFHVVLKRLDDGSFEGKFQFFRLGENGLVSSGETKVITSLDASGSAVSKITGSGKIMVFDKLTNQSHELAETLSYSQESGLKSKGTGEISVSGMPLGLGKHGKVKESKSAWTIKDGVLNIEQQMCVSFKALFVSQTYGVQAHYTARRGSDVSAMLKEATQVSSQAQSGCGPSDNSQD